MSFQIKEKPTQATAFMTSCTKNKDILQDDPDDLVIEILVQSPSANRTKTLRPTVVKNGGNEKERSKQFHCNNEHCYKSFKSEYSLKKHAKVCKPGPHAKYICEICGLQLHSSSSLQNHMKIHSDIKPYRCNECGLLFRLQSGLTRHTAVHSDVKPYKCSICHKRFKQKDYVKSHMLSHTGEKPFPCSYCGKCFSRRHELNRHEIIHKGTKPYICPDCGSQFADSSTCRRHAAIHKRRHTESLPRASGDDHNSNTIERSLKITCQLCRLNCSTVDDLQNHMTSCHYEYVSDVSVPSVNALQYVFKENNELFVILQKFDGRKYTIEKRPINDDLASVCRHGLLPSAKGEAVKQSAPSASVQKPAANQITTLNTTNKPENPVGNLNISNVAEYVSVNVTESVPLNVMENAISLLQSNFLSEPNFDSQEFYDWLSEFTELSHQLAMPLSVVIFNKINRLEKAVTEKLANPVGFMRSRDNYVVLMSTCTQLRNVINSHLQHVMETLEPTV